MVLDLRYLAVFAIVIATVTPDAMARGSDPSAAPSARRVSGEPTDDRPSWIAKRRKKRGKRRPRKAPKAAPSETPEPTPPGLPAAPPLQETDGRKVLALLPLQTVQLTDALLTSIENDLLTEIAEAGGMVAVAPADVRGDLEVLSEHGYPAPFQTESCNGNVECLAIAGRYARAHYAVETRISGVGGTVKIAMRYVDAQQRKELARVADVVSETDADERARQLHRLAVQLLQRETYVGSLQVDVDEPNADVYLNDQLVGTTKEAGGLRLTKIAAGPYILRVSKDGFSDVYQFVDVVYRNVSTYRVNLNENTIASTLVEQESERGFGDLYIYTASGEFELRIDGAPQGRVPLEGGPLAQIAAGKRRLSLRYEGGQPIVEPVPVERGRRTEVQVEEGPDGYRIGRVEIVDADSPLPEARLAAVLSPDASVQSVVGQSPELGWRFNTGLVVAGLGVVGLGAGLYYSREVSSIDDDARALELEFQESGPFEEGSEQLTRAQQINDDGDAATANQVASYAIGGVLVAVGTSLVLWDLLRSSDAPAASAPAETSIDVQATVLPGGGFLGLGLEF